MIEPLAVIPIEAGRLTGKAYIDLPAVVLGGGIGAFLVWRKGKGPNRRTALIAVVYIVVVLLVFVTIIDVFALHGG